MLGTVVNSERVMVTTERKYVTVIIEKQMEQKTETGLTQTRIG